MKTGRTLSELAAEIQRQSESKRDFIAPTQQLKMTLALVGEPSDPSHTLTPEMQVNGHGNFGILDNAHNQIASRLGIPRTYYDRLNEQAPELLAENVNHWLQAQPERRMVRTLDNNVRAFLSDRFRPLDNFDLAENVLPVILDNGCRVESAQLTERKLYIKAVTERVTAEIRKGDIVQSGIVISNSEVGHGSVKIEPLVYRLACLNGMIANDHAMRKYHVGGNAKGDIDLAAEFFRDETRKQSDKAFWMQVRDVVEGSFKRDIFEKIVNSMRDATERVITGDPVKVVEVTQKRLGLTEVERSSVLTALIREGDLTQYGLMNAITFTSQSVEDYDRATDLERFGSEIIELPQSEWRELAAAA